LPSSQRGSTSWWKGVYLRAKEDQLAGGRVFTFEPKRIRCEVVATEYLHQVPSFYYHSSKINIKMGVFLLTELPSQVLLLLQ